MNRIVTGHDKKGTAIFVQAGAPRHIVSLPGKTYYELWATSPNTCLPLADPTVEPTKACDNMFPAEGETRIRVVEWSGDGDISNPNSSEVLSTYKKEMPGFLEHMEGGVVKSGFHETKTVDYGVLLDGEMELELDDGKIVRMLPGDVVIQNGTRHAWHPKVPCKMLWVLVGVRSEK